MQEPWLGSRPAEVIRTKRIEAQEIILRSPDGKRSISLVANNDVAGVWIQDDADGPLVCIYTTDAQTCLGIYSPGDKEIVNIGIALDQQGEPMLQIAPKGKPDRVKHLTIDD